MSCWRWIYGASGRRTRLNALRALAAVGLSHRASAHPSKVSGGEKHCVAIAWALAGSPSVILADEPTAALDGDNGKAIRALLAPPTITGRSPTATA